MASSPPHLCNVGTQLLILQPRRRLGCSRLGTFATTSTSSTPEASVSPRYHVDCARARARGNAQAGTRTSTTIPSSQRRSAGRPSLRPISPGPQQAQNFASRRSPAAASASRSRITTSATSIPSQATRAYCSSTADASYAHVGAAALAQPVMLRASPTANASLACSLAQQSRRACYAPQLGAR